MCQYCRIWSRPRQRSFLCVADISLSLEVPWCQRRWPKEREEERSKDRRIPGPQCPKGILWYSAELLDQNSALWVLPRLLLHRTRYRSIHHPEERTRTLDIPYYLPLLTVVHIFSCLLYRQIRADGLQRSRYMDCDIMYFTMIKGQIIPLQPATQTNRRPFSLYT